MICFVFCSVFANNFLFSFAGGWNVREQAKAKKHRKECGKRSHVGRMAEMAKSGAASLAKRESTIEQEWRGENLKVSGYR